MRQTAVMCPNRLPKVPTMTPESAAEWEVAIVLPLGAVANQLRRIETQLRLLNMKALGFAKERDNRALQLQVESRLNQISETLGSVAALVSDIEADVSPSRTKVTRLALDEETSSIAERDSAGARPSFDDSGRSHHSAPKRTSDRDD